MENLHYVREKIFAELLSDDAEVRGKYVKRFEAQAATFAEHMSHAIIAWQVLDEQPMTEELAYVSALVFTALSLNVLSMKAFLGGQVVGAGNLFRQVTETVALSLLCSHRDLHTRRQFMKGKYSSNNAIRDALGRWKELGVVKDALEALQKAQKYYHAYSHPSRHTIAAVTSFSGEGLYFTSAFDEGKIDAYTKEIAGRVNLAGTFVSFIEAVRVNVAKW